MDSDLKLLSKTYITGLDYQLKKRDIAIQIPEDEIFNLPEKIIVLGNSSLIRMTINYFLDYIIKKKEFGGRIIQIELRDENLIKNMKAQDFLYTLNLKGLDNGNIKDEWVLITSIKDGLYINEWNKILEYIKNPEIFCLICYYDGEIEFFTEEDSIKNTPPKSYIGLILSLLYERYRRFKSKDIIFNVISLNPKFKGNITLREKILEIGKTWSLGEKFLSWIRLKVRFFDSIIDKLDIGNFSNDEIQEYCLKLGYKDNFLLLTENYNKWIINNPKKIKFPISSLENFIEFTDNLNTIFQLNTWFNVILVSFIPIAFLSGYDKTNEALKDVIINDFFEKFLFNTIKKFVELPESELRIWGKTILTRLKNPFNRRTLIDMSENLIKKFREEFLYKMIEFYEKEKNIPEYIYFILATILRFYNIFEENGKYYGIRNLILDSEEKLIENNLELDYDSISESRNNYEIYEVKDDPDILKDFCNAWKDVNVNDSRSLDIFLSYILTQKRIWGMDLTLWPDLFEKTKYYLDRLLHEDIGKITSELLLGIN